MPEYQISVSVGKQITRIKDPLTKVPLQKVYEFIRNPGPEHQEMINRLRALIQISPEKYRDEKKKLPYMVCASFVPLYRHTANFATTESFILDLDHLAEREINIDELKDKLKADANVAMFFQSPGGDGLKILFQLSERCDDVNIYTLFYKVFVKRFGEKYQIEQLVDSRTSDVTRACFLSFDPEAWINPQVEPVEQEQYLPLENDLEMQSLFNQFSNFPQKTDEDKKVAEQKSQPEKEVLKQIRLILNPNALQVVKKEAFVPEELKVVLPLLTEQLAEHNISAVNIESIQYGKKMRFSVGVLWAEINLFYGKNGFSVVKTTKTGSNEELAETIEALIRQLLFKNGCYVK